MAKAKSRVDVILSLKDNMRTGLAKATMSLNKLSSAAQRMGMITAAATGTMVLGLGKVVKMAAELDDSFRLLAARLGTTVDTDAFVKLEKETRRLGRTTSYTTNQVAQMMTVLAQAGRTASEIDSMSESILNLSRAMGEETADAAKTAQTVMASYGLGMDFVGRTVDTLTETVNGSNTSLYDLNEAFNYAAPTAKAFGSTIERTSAQLAILANNGIRGSRAGVQLRAAQLQLASVGFKTADELNIDLEDASGSFRDLNDIFRDFQMATSEMTDVKKMQVYKKAFGKVGISSALILGKQADAVDNFTKKLDNSAGAAKRASDEIDGGIGGSFRMLYSAFEDMILMIGKAFIPMVKKATDQIRGMILSMQGKDLATPIYKLIVGMAQLTGVLLGVSVALKMLLFSLAGTAFAISTVSSAASIASSSVGALAVGVGKLSLASARVTGFHKPYVAMGTAAAKAAKHIATTTKAQRTLNALNAGAARGAASLSQGSAIANKMKSAQWQNIKNATNNANLTYGTKLTPSSALGSGKGLSNAQRGLGATARPYRSNLTGGAGPASELSNAQKFHAANKGTLTAAAKARGDTVGVKQLTRGLKGMGGSNLAGVTTDSLMAGVGKGIPAANGAIGTGGASNMAAQVAKTNQQGIAAVKAGIAHANSVSNQMILQGAKNTHQTAMTARGLSMGKTLATGIGKGFGMGLKAAKSFGPQVILFTALEGVYTALTGSEMQSATAGAADILTGRLFVSIGEGIKRGAAVISQGMFEAFELAAAGDWVGALETLKLAIQTALYSMVDGLSDGFKELLNAIVNFEKGTFITWIRSITRGFTTLAAGIVSVVNALGRLAGYENITGMKGLNATLDGQAEYDRELEGRGHLFDGKTANDRRTKNSEQNVAKDAYVKQKRWEAEKLARRVAGDRRMAARDAKVALEKAKKREDAQKVIDGKKRATAVRLARMESLAKEKIRQKALYHARHILRMNGVASKRNPLFGTEGNESEKEFILQAMTKEGETGHSSLLKANQIGKVTASSEAFGGLGGQGIRDELNAKFKDTAQKNYDSSLRQEEYLKNIAINTAIETVEDNSIVN